MKKYNNEKAIISLTSWKNRISTVGKTIFNLLHTCKGYHIVIVLSEDEFKNKEKDLPEDLKLIIESNLIEILWVKKNYKSFKKVIFTSLKYPNTPIISADDDCYYTYNYADELYNIWKNNKDTVVTNSHSFGSGWGIIFPPNIFKNLDIKILDRDDLIATNHDDLFYKTYCKRYNIKTQFIRRREECAKLIKFHDDVNSITSTGTAVDYKNKDFFNKLFNL